MAATGDPKGGFKQDMVVSIRYRNDLPPPPMPPKLLDIDNGGLAQYLTTSFAAAMARREEPNIEIDAEGGMPIDMIGIPGYFLGDESAILAPEIQPVLDPADHALMLTPEQLRNQDSKSTNVSFLRRTQYMTSQNARANDPLIRTNARNSKSINKSALQPEILARDGKENIKRHLQKGFDLAYPDSTAYNSPDVSSQPATAAEREAWRNPVHPDNPNLKPVSFFPIVPDFDTEVDAGGFHYIHFDKPPLAPLHGRRDERIDVGLLRGNAIQSLLAAHNARKEAYEQNPEKYDNPGAEPYAWSFCVPEGEDTTAQIRRILDNANLEKDDPALWADLLDQTSGDDLRVDFKKVRTYVNPKTEDIVDNKTMAISLVEPKADASGTSSEGVACYYPVVSSMNFKGDRGKMGRATQQSNPEDAPEGKFDLLSIRFRELGADEIVSRSTYRGTNDLSYATKFAEFQKNYILEKDAMDAEDVEDEQGSLQGGGQDVKMGEEDEEAEQTNVAANGFHHASVDTDQMEVARNGQGDIMEE